MWQKAVEASRPSSMGATGSNDPCNGSCLTFTILIPMKKVLVADDNADSRELIRTVLERSGHLIFEASDGTEALRCARELLPDLIILDLQMPALDGFDALQELRRDQRFAATPIVALTASAMAGDRERTLSTGFTGYIAKPINLSALRDEMERFLR